MRFTIASLASALLLSTGAIAAPTPNHYPVTHTGPFKGTLHNLNNGKYADRSTRS